MGQVWVVSADAFEDERSGLGCYRAEIVPDAGELAKLPAGQVLIPGMPVETIIRTADRSPRACRIKPMADYFNCPFCES